LLKKLSSSLLVPSNEINMILLRFVFNARVDDGGE
jgi:hypothetical protein